MPGISRRTLLTIGASAAPVAWLPGCVRNEQAERVDGVPAMAPQRHPVVVGRYTYFTAAEIAFVDAAVARLIPVDALGPGAAEAGVTLFIDQQLAGPFGKASCWYMEGPWSKGTKFQGYQSKRTPAELYRAAIAAIDVHCQVAFDRQVFAALGADDQDEVLRGLEKEEIALPGVVAKTFFDMLWQNTQEGFFADPMYEGNRDFIGWKLVGFPGPRYNYVSEIAHYGQPYPLPTVGLLGRDPSRRPRSAA